MPLTVVRFLIPVPQAALPNHRPVELKLSRLIDPKASLSVTSVQVAVEDCNPNQSTSGLPGPTSAQLNDDVLCIPRPDLYAPTPRVRRAIYG